MEIRVGKTKANLMMRVSKQHRDGNGKDDHDEGRGEVRRPRHPHGHETVVLPRHHIPYVTWSRRSSVSSIKFVFRIPGHGALTMLFFTSGNNPDVFLTFVILVLGQLLDRCDENVVVTQELLEQQFGEGVAKALVSGGIQRHQLHTSGRNVFAYERGRRKISEDKTKEKMVD